MTPGFFGPAGEQLLGVHHPARGSSKSHGVVLCNPAPQETARTHWAFRKLAEALSKAGFDVLRFDYRGTGDSNGELEHTSPAQWVEDVRRAVAELKGISGVRKVSAVGFRLGAMLLAQAASQGVALENVVLWEPVVNAANWIERLRNVERQLNRSLSRPPKEQREHVLGFVVPEALLQQWEALELTNVPAWPQRTAVICAQRDAHLERLHRHLKSAAWHDVPEAGGDAKTGALLGNAALERIVGVLS
ncbi:MAG: alpha/beta fold hydrolase [Myxococcaceae bacterium]